MTIRTQNPNPTKKQKIFLFGAGMHSQTCINIIEQQDKFELVGIIDSEKEVGSFIEDYPILGRMDDLIDLANKYETDAGIIGIGFNWVRRKVALDILSLIPNFEFVNVIHPTAVFGKNILFGKGILIGAMSFISSSCIIGNFCFLHQKAHLGLQNRMDNYSSLSAGALTGGKVNIGTCTAVTLGVIVHDRINIGSHSVVGSGSLVTKDIPSYVVAYGHPAKIIRNRQEKDDYLKHT